MVNFIKLLGLCAILLFSMVSAAKLNKQQEKAWFVANEFLKDSHSILEPRFRTPTDFKVPEGDVEKAWEHAYNQDKGSLYTNKVEGHPKTVYVLTKIPNGSQLGKEWKLDDPARNAFLFWRIKKGKGHKLLLAQTWSVGGVATGRKKLQDIVETVARF